MDAPARPEDMDCGASPVAANVVPQDKPASADVEPMTVVDNLRHEHVPDPDHDPDPFVDPEHVDVSVLDNCWDDASTPQPTSSYIPAGSFDDVTPPAPTLDASTSTTQTTTTTDELDPPSSHTSLTNGDDPGCCPVESSAVPASASPAAPASLTPLVTPEEAAAQVVASREQEQLEAAPLADLEVQTRGDGDDDDEIQTEDSAPSSLVSHPSVTTPRPSRTMVAPFRFELERHHGDVGSSPDPLGMTPVASSATASRQPSRPRSQSYTSRLSRADSEPLDRASASALATPTAELSPATTWPHTFTLEVENRPMKRSTPPRHPSTSQDERFHRGNSILAEVPPSSHGDDSGSDDELGLAPPPRQASSLASRKGKSVANPKPKLSAKGKGKAVVKPRAGIASQSAQTSVHRKSSFSIEVPFHASPSLASPRARETPHVDTLVTAPSSTQGTEVSLATEATPLSSARACALPPANIPLADIGSPLVAPSSELTILSSSRLGTPEPPVSSEVAPMEVDEVDQPREPSPPAMESEAASQSQNEAAGTIVSPCSSMPAPISAQAPTAPKATTPPPSPPKKRVPRALIERQASMQSSASGSTSKKRLEDSDSSDEDMRPQPTSSTTFPKTKRVPRPKLSQSQTGSVKGRESPTVDIPAKRRASPLAKRKLVQRASSSDDDEEGKENGQHDDESSDLSDLSEYAESPRKKPVNKKRRSDAKPSGTSTIAGQQKGSNTSGRAATQSKVATTTGTQQKSKMERSAEDDDESMKDAESPATTQPPMPSQSQPTSTNPLGYVLAQIAPRETEDQRRSNWNVLRLDNLVWTLVEADNGARFWWPADMTSPSKKPPLLLTLLQDDEQTILQLKPTGAITIDDPQPTNVLTWRTEGKIRFDKTSFCEPSTIEDAKTPSVTAFESVLMKSWELEQRRAEDEAADEDEDESGEATVKANSPTGAKASKKGRQSVSSSPRKGTPNRRKNGKKATSKDLNDENGSSDDELLRTEDESVGIEFPAIALGFADRAWWGCQVLDYTPAPSQGRQGHRAKGKFSVEFIDGKIKNLTRKQIILPIQEEFLTVKLGQSVLNVSKNYEQELRQNVDGFKDQMQAIIDEELPQAKHWNEEYHAGGNRRVRLAKDALLGELTPEYIEAVVDQIKRWAAGEDNVRRKGSDRYEALNETDRSRYNADVLLPLVVQLLTIDELDSRDEGKKVLMEEDGIAEPTEAQIEDKAFQLARIHLEKGSIMKTIEAIRSMGRR